MGRNTITDENEGKTLIFPFHWQ